MYCHMEYYIHIVYIVLHGCHMKDKRDDFLPDEWKLSEEEVKAMKKLIFC